MNHDPTPDLHWKTWAISLLMCLSLIALLVVTA